MLQGSGLQRTTLRNVTTSDKEYLDNLRQHASETQKLLSNAQKPERERMVVRAFLKCIGEPFTDAEIKPSTVEPVDTVFRSAQFQVRDILGGRKRGDDLAARRERYEKAERLADLLEPWQRPEPMSFADISAEVAQALAAKATRYGFGGCAALDALVYVDLHGRHLWSPKFMLDARIANDLHAQGWRSVSFVFLPYGVVLTAKREAPAFIRDRQGLVLNKWPGPDGWFEP
jgi:hypothetical protein